MTERPDPVQPGHVTELNAISPLDGRYWEQVKELSPYASEGALIRTRVEVEAKFLIALSEIGLVRPLTDDETERLMNLGPQMSDEQVEHVKKIEDTTRHDVKAMERGFRDMVSGTSLEDATEMIHFGLTSEDVNNLSYRLLLDRARRDVMVPALDKVVDGFAKIADEQKTTPMLARTHGQAAVPTTLGKEMVNIAVRLNGQVRKLDECELSGKLNGAVGNYNALALAAPEVDWIGFSEKFVKSLGFAPNLLTTQINPYEDVIEMLQIYQRINGIIVDANQDMWRYISDNWFAQEAKKGEVGSSTMPQKVNPIDFENSEGNAQTSIGTFETFSRKFATSRLQRDLSDSTTVRNIGAGLGHSLLAYKSILRGLSRVSPNKEAIQKALDENWAILTEGAQTVLRRAGVKDPYSLASSFARGQYIGADEWKEWIDGLDVDDNVKAKLAGLTPQKYIGKAVELTDLALSEIAASRRN